MNYKNIKLYTEGYKHRDGVEWLKTHCIELNKDHKVDSSFYHLDFKFGNNEEDAHYHTTNASISREDAIAFMSAYLDKLFGVNGYRIYDEHYHIDSIYFASDGDTYDCQYEIKASVYRVF